MTLKDLVLEHRIDIPEICYGINKIAILDGYELFSSGLGIKFLLFHIEGSSTESKICPNLILV